MAQVATLLSLDCFILALLGTGVGSTTFTVVNRCGDTVWPGLLSGAGAALLPTTGFALQPGEATAIADPAGACGTGRVCAQDATTGKFSCLTGRIAAPRPDEKVATLRSNGVQKSHRKE